jgi:hypothetical protein
MDVAKHNALGAKTVIVTFEVDDHQGHFSSTVSPAFDLPRRRMRFRQRPQSAGAADTLT